MKRRHVAIALGAVTAVVLALAYRGAAGTLLLGDLVAFCG